MMRQTPVNMYGDGKRITLAAPMPGMEPANIWVEVEGRRVTINGDARGPGQESRTDYVLKEWSSGPYRREVELPFWVDASQANATYDNGILVVILPAANAGTSGRITLEKVGTAKGQAIGHAGRNTDPR